MHRPHRMAVVLCAGALMVSGCYGPFNLTRRLYQWNGQVGGKWEREFLFILLAWAPVYGLTVLGDAVVFNSMEFWTGNNPVDAPGKTRSERPRATRIARGMEEAILTYTPGNGAQLLIEQFRHGQPAGSLRVQQRDGMTLGADANGHVLFTAQTLPDGSVLIHDQDGQVVATYSAQQVEQFVAVAHRAASNP